MPLLGPIFATVAGVAAAYGATKSGPAGDACRAAGDVALSAKAKAVEVNQKHDIVGKTRSGAQSVLAKARDADGRHDILKKLGIVLAGTFRTIGEAFKLAARKMQKRGGQENDNGYEEFNVQK